ncbi:MAG TPA: ATPase, T2SS/T4P/T4SS family [Acidimicrobiales bacterium]|nr:ATPase, T2SS/T4P/T4SS family [Acidimicrobiales bacterium]
MATGTVGGGSISPLAYIERAVQERAKALALDVGGPAATGGLRRLVDEEIGRWHDEYHRGRRPFDIAEPGVAAERALRNLTGYGPLQPLLDDPDVWEIVVNAPDAIFARRHEGPSGYHDEVFHDDDHVVRILTKLLDDAGRSHRKLDPAEGLQDAQLETGARLHIVHGDVGRDGHLLINIRKFTGVRYRRMSELAELGMFDLQVAAFLRACVRSGLSVLVAGPPGSGKTTLLSCLAAELDPSLRVVVAEEVFETDIPLPNVAHMQTRPARVDRGEVDLRRLVSGFLRMAPDVAVVGEVRDREALPLLLTLSSGVQGFTTIHAGSARQALSRLRFICQLADTGSELSLPALSALVSEAVDVVVHCARYQGTPVVTEILAVEDLHVGPETVAFTTTPVWSRARRDAPLRWTGNLPVRAGRALDLAGYEVRRLVDDSGPPGAGGGRPAARLAAAPPEAGHPSPVPPLSGRWEAPS